MIRILIIIAGIIIAAIGGAIAYRAWFLEPTAAVVITDERVRDLPDILRLAGGLTLLIFGALLAFFAARRRSS